MALLFLQPQPLPTLSPTRARLRPICSQTPPSRESLEQAYKSAKAAYKAAKRAKLPNEQLTPLQATYKRAKASYKHSKYPPTPIYPTTPTVPTPSMPSRTAAPSPSQGVVVCGGTSCRRLGADLVASMLRLDAPNGKCMKRCGGVGPTIRVDDQPVKVDFRGALQSALRTAVHNYNQN